MVNRVLLDANGLKVSKAGVNVLTALDVDLTFNSSYSVPAALQKGRFYITYWQGTGQPVPTHTVNFTRSFTNVPICCFYVDLANNPSNFTGNQHFGSHRRDRSNDPVPEERSWYDCVVSNTGFTFRNHLIGGSQWDLIVQYFIWDSDT